MELATQRRVERMIRECRALGIEPEPRTIAEIMVDDDVTNQKYENWSAEWKVAFAEYSKAAARVLGRRQEPWIKRDERRRA